MHLILNRKFTVLKPFVANLCLRFVFKPKNNESSRLQKSTF